MSIYIKSSTCFVPIIQANTHAHTHTETGNWGETGHHHFARKVAQSSQHFSTLGLSPLPMWIRTAKYQDDRMCFLLNDMS